MNQKVNCTSCNNVFKLIADLSQSKIKLYTFERSLRLAFCFNMIDR